MGFISNLKAKCFRDLAFIDFRALATFRIGLGLVLLADFFTKALDLTAFYTDRGIFPRELAIQFLGWWSFSFHMASGAFWFQALLMAIGFTLALCLTLGYQTRIVVILTWLFVVSIQGRNHLILHSGDALIRLTLFWAMFLPLEARYSLDRYLLKRRGERYEAAGVTNIASLAILLQLLYVYFFTAMLKTHPEWHRTFEAVYYAMSLEQFTTPLGQFLLNFPQLLSVLTFLTYYLEFVGPILLLIPFIQNYMRSSLPFAFMGLHFSLFLCMYLGLFPWICIVCWILFLPPRFFDSLERVFGKLLRPLAPGTLSLLARLAPHLPLTSVWRRPRRLSQLVSFFLFFCLATVTAWNVSALPQVDHELPPVVRSFVLPQRLDQYWSMFSPYPMRADGWFVVDGKLKDGTSFDTWNNMPVSWEKPADVFHLYRSTQWRKYLTNIWLEKEPNSIRLAFGKFVCREWNDFKKEVTADKKLMSYQLYYMKEVTPPPGESPKVQKILHWNHNCFGDPESPRSDRPPQIKN